MGTWGYTGGHLRKPLLGHVGAWGHHGAAVGICTGTRGCVGTPWDTTGNTSVGVERECTPGKFHRDMGCRASWTTCRNSYGDNRGVLGTWEPPLASCRMTRECVGTLWSSCRNSYGDTGQHGATQGSPLGTFTKTWECMGTPWDTLGTFMGTHGSPLGTSTGSWGCVGTLEGQGGLLWELPQGFWGAWGRHSPPGM